jgi:hypothetical protein
MMVSNTSRSSLFLGLAVWLSVTTAMPARGGGGETFDCPDCHPLGSWRLENWRPLDWELGDWRPASWRPLTSWRLPQWHARSSWPLLEPYAAWHAAKREKHIAFTGTGCGPRYWGAYHSEPLRCDPCDACNRWTGYCGGHQMPDMLAPWQLPPCRGFRSPAEVGYGPVNVCRGCKTPTSVWW